MRIIAVLASEVILAVLLISCKTNSNTPGPNSGLKIDFSESVYDYGELAFAIDANCEFEFRNLSDKQLIINKVITSCGCTHAKWPRETIEPGMKGIISIGYDTEIQGYFRKSITVYSNVENSPVKLFITGNVLDKKHTF